MKYIIKFNNTNNKLILLRKEFTHNNVMVFREEELHYVMILSTGSTIKYSKEYYKVQEELCQSNV